MNFLSLNQICHLLTFLQFPLCSVAFSESTKIFKTIFLSCGCSSDRLTQRDFVWRKIFFFSSDFSRKDFPKGGVRFLEETVSGTWLGIRTSYLFPLYVQGQLAVPTHCPSFNTLPFGQKQPSVPDLHLSPCFT